MTKANDQVQNWIPELLVALLLGIGLRELYRLSPNGLTAVIAPVNSSIWEQMKTVFWPLLAVEFGCFTAKHRLGGLLSLLLMCSGMLLGSWFLRFQLETTDYAMELGIFGLCILGHFLFSEAVRVTQRIYPLLLALVALLGALFVLFTLSPPHGALFSS